jgi:hypothetical protein
MSQSKLVKAIDILACKWMAFGFMTGMSCGGMLVFIAIHYLGKG